MMLMLFALMLYVQNVDAGGMNCEFVLRMILSMLLILLILLMLLMFLLMRVGNREDVDVLCLLRMALLASLMLLWG